MVKRLRTSAAALARAGASLLMAAMAWSASAQAGDASGGVEIRRTADGIPHIRAADWHGLGYGYGYAQAQDVLCTLAEAFVTYQGRRSYFFGADGRPKHNSTFGRSPNLELDVFFRAFVDDKLVAEYRRRQPVELDRLVEGFASGYNRYVREAKQAAAEGGADRACAGEPWIQEISAEDVYRRMHAAGIAAGYARFVPQIVNARPPGEGQAAGASPERAAADLSRRLAHAVGEQPGLGSNALAFGRAATGEEAGVLFGNPHWFWGGPDRFYQAHLTLPGRLDVAGVSFLGVPVIMIGFNEYVAWSHTVSTARRFGLFELALDPADPTAYRYDGAVEPMERVPVTVEVRREDGNVEALTRTLYRTRLGPVVDFGARAAAFGWGRERALAIRDVNADNFRIFQTFFRWNQARSLDEFIAIQREEAAIPWVNTVAIGRGDGRVWFGDVGAVPNVPDELRRRCAGALARPFAGLDPAAPLLDGSRSSCDWVRDADAVQPGAMPAARMPALLTDDYVANMNDSYWLTNPAKPLEGYDRILGGEGEALSLRSQAGHRLADDLVRSEAGSARALAHRLREAVLDARAHSAVRFKTPLLEAVCRDDSVTVVKDLLTGDTFDPPRTVDIAPACRTLARWSGGGNAEDRGSVLWDGWWARLRRIPDAEFYRVPVSRKRPLATPTAPAVADPRVAEAFGAAVLASEKAGRPLDAKRGAALAVSAGGRRVPLFGGCSLEGYFTIACGGEDQYAMDANGHGNSYLQVVRFAVHRVEAYTLLAHGQDERALEGGPGAAPVLRHARKDWLRMPFSEEEIARDPRLERTVLRP